MQTMTPQNAISSLPSEFHPLDLTSMLPKPKWDDDDLAPRSTKKTIDNKPYVIREASADANSKYRHAILSTTERGADGVITKVLPGFEETDYVLLAECIYPDTETGTRCGYGHLDGQQKPIGIDVIKSWPDRVTKVLIGLVKEMSNIEQPQSVAQVQKQITALETIRKRLLFAGDGRKNASDGTPVS